MSEPDDFMDQPIGTTGLTVREFDEASNHPEKCQCRICKLWHEEVGPEDDEP